MGQHPGKVSLVGHRCMAITVRHHHDCALSLLDELRVPDEVQHVITPLYLSGQSRQRAVLNSLLALR